MEGRIWKENNLKWRLWRGKWCNEFIINNDKIIFWSKPKKCFSVHLQWLETRFINLLKPTGYVMHRQLNLLKPTGYVMHQQFILLKPTGYVMHQQFNIQQLYVLPTLNLCVLYLSEKQTATCATYSINWLAL